MATFDVKVPAATPIPVEGVEGPVLRIEPSRGWVALKLRELWTYRELLYFLAWRDVKVRYKQTALGASWALLQPLLTMLVFSLIFGRLAKMPSDGIPYPIFTLAGLAPWTFFAQGLTQSATSLVGNSQLIGKVYFPRLAVPLATVLATLVDFALTFLLLVGMMLIYGIRPNSHIVYVPVFALMALITSLEVGFWLSALNVNYRDIRYVVPFMVQFWMFATPIVYPSRLLPEPWRTLYGLNPMAGVVEGFRWSLLGVKTQLGPMMAISAAVSLAVLVSGMFYFRRMERTFADVI
jgi:lipopolysaccharide transport system permease protein